MASRAPSICALCRALSLPVMMFQWAATRTPRPISLAVLLSCRRTPSACRATSSLTPASRLATPGRCSRWGRCQGGGSMYRVWIEASLLPLTHSASRPSTLLAPCLTTRPKMFRAIPFPRTCGRTASGTIRWAHPWLLLMRIQSRVWYPSLTQYCTELMPEETYFTRDGVNDMFPIFSINESATTAHCLDAWGVKPRFSWMKDSCAWDGCMEGLRYCPVASTLTRPLCFFCCWPDGGLNFTGSNVCVSIT